MANVDIRVVDLQDFKAGGERREQFVRDIGEALTEIGFFAIKNHGVDSDTLGSAYQRAAEFFHLPVETKSKYAFADAKGQRGYTPFGTEHAKDSTAPDLKEFWQVGRVDVGADHPVHAAYGPNRWPEEDCPGFGETMTELYRSLDALGADLLRACAMYIGEDPELFTRMVDGGDTIIRVLHYPAIEGDVPEGSIRAAAHEDINLITLLSGATSEGLELLTHSGDWVAIEAKHDHFLVDTGDMMQNVTNGLYKSTTHRVVNPEDPSQERFSMPCFIHPRKDVDLSPLQSCVERSGGVKEFQDVTAGEYLAQRLREIGLE